MKIWVGPKESDINNTNGIYSGSITFYGSGSNNNKSLSSDYAERYNSNKATKLHKIIEIMKRAVQQNPNSEFSFYNEQLAHSILREAPQLADNIPLHNTHQMLSLLSDKTYTRLWLGRVLPIIPFVLLTKNDLKISKLKNMFTSHSDNMFIIQESISSGGLGTHLVNQENAQEIIGSLQPGQVYLVSAYIKCNIPVNCHVLITDSEILVFPFSVQIVEVKNSKLIYKGADFAAIEQLVTQSDKLYRYARIISAEVQKLGFRGCMGIDFLLTETGAFFVEINPRYQASTQLLNLILVNSSLPSIQYIAEKYFDDNYLSIEQKDLLKLKPSNSFYKYEYEDTTNGYLLGLKFQLLKNENYLLHIVSDGFRANQAGIVGAYAFQAFFATNIIGPEPNNGISIHPNISLYENGIGTVSYASPKTLLTLKLELLNLGLRLEESAKNHCIKIGHFNKSVFGSIDIIILDNFRFNAPFEVKFSNLSPFSLLCQKGQLQLHYNERYLCDIKIEKRNALPDLVTRSGIAYDEIAFLSGDRLRIKTERKCYYKSIQQGCLFCPGKAISSKDKNDITIDDIKEVLEYCLNVLEFRHILIGGGSADPHSNTASDKILKTIKAIRKRCNKPIYLMCTPPSSKGTVIEYCKAGIDEIAFNLETYDRDAAKKFMPGKGIIPLQQYIQAFETAAKYLGKEGNVRSMLIIGLEKRDTLLQGIEALCALGVQPMLSALRPMQNSGLYGYVPPTNEYIFDIYASAKSICEKHNQQLGPSCPSCQNNTIAFTLT